MGGTLPDPGKVMALVHKLLKGADLNTMTVRQMREAVQQELKGEAVDYNFEDASFKALVKQLVTEAVQQQHQQTEEKENGHGEKGASKGNKKKEEEEEEGSSSEEEEDDDDEEVEDSSDAEEDDDDASTPGSKRKKKSAGKGGGAGVKKPKKKKEEKEEKPVDPKFKLLQDLARAMALTPAIYKGFGEMTHEEKVEALRERLKEKGADFDRYPTQQDIKKAQEKKQLERDLEGIDMSNVIEDGRRRRGGSDPEPVKKVDKAKKKKKAAIKEDASSASEEELEFD